jgi:flagellar basal body rod protein FlgB
VPTTFQKRQKEMKRMEKQRMKAERRAQRKIEKNSPQQPEDTDNVMLDTELPEVGDSQIEQN